MEERAESLREEVMSIEVEVAQLKSERSQIQSQIEASLQLIVQIEDIVKGWIPASIQTKILGHWSKNQ